jgi:hypothetical protein
MAFASSRRELINNPGGEVRGNGDYTGRRAQAARRGAESRQEIGEEPVAAAVTLSVDDRKGGFGGKPEVFLCSFTGR